MFPMRERCPHSRSATPAPRSPAAFGRREGAGGRGPADGYQPSPFCVLDEVDAPLDEANIERLTRLLREMSTETQFIVITHSKKTMESAAAMYGVTMQEPGVSKLVSVKFQPAAA
jgi:hypothetical protein